MIDTLNLEADVVRLRCLDCGALFPFLNFIADGDLFSGVIAVSSQAIDELVVAQLTPEEFNSGDGGLRLFEERLNVALNRNDLATALPIWESPAGITYRCIRCQGSRAVKESSQTVAAFIHGGGRVSSYPLGAIRLH